MEGIYTEAVVKKQYKTAQLQFQLEEDINLPELKPDLDVLIAEKWNVVTTDVKVGNGKVCVDGEVEYLILYSREDATSRLEVLSGTFPFNQCLIMEHESGEPVYTKVSVVGEQIKKRNSRKLSVLLTLEMEARDEGPFSCRFMEDLMEEAEKQTGSFEMASLCHMGREDIEIKEVLSLPSNRPDIGRILIDHIQPRGVEVYMEDGRFIIRGEMFVFALYESAEDNPHMQFLEMTVPFEREAECGFCRDDMLLESSCGLKRTRLVPQENEDGEDRELAVTVEMELCYELKEKKHIEYLQDAYSLTEEIRPVRREMMFEKIGRCSMQRIRLNDIFSPPLDEKMLQIYPVKASVALSESEVVEGGVLIEGNVAVELLYLTANPSDPPVMAKMHLPFHQQLAENNVRENARVQVNANVVQLSANIIDSGRAEIKIALNIDVCVNERQSIPVITEIEYPEVSAETGRIPGLTGYVVQPGDTLWSLAKENKTTIGEICKINQLSEASVSPGDRLIIERFALGR